MRTRVVALVLLTILMGSLIILPTEAAAGGNYWVKSYGGNGNDVINDVKVLSDGGIILMERTLLR